jgi:hypothetical protein
MRYLRMLTNAAIAGALGAAFVGVLILQLNPQLPLSWPVVLPLGATVLLFYGANLAVAFYLLIVVRQLFASRVLSPGWISMRLLAWLGTLVCTGAAALMSQNLELFGPVLPDEAARRMALGMWATGACAMLLLGIAVLHYSSKRPRASAVGASLFSLTLAAALLLPLTARGWGGGQPRLVPPPAAVPASPVAGPAGRLRLVLLDGASLDFIAVATAGGRLPHIGRMLDGGASLHLTTIRPTQPAPVWAAATTGKLPDANGVRSAATYRAGRGGPAIELLPDLCFAHAMVHLGLLREQMHTAQALRARTLWQMLSGFGIPVGVVGLPLTQPAPSLAGYVVSDRTHLVANTLLPVDDRGLVFPADAFAWGVPGPLDATPPAGMGPDAGQHDPLLVSGEFSARDAWYRRVGAMLEARYAPRVAAVRYDGLDLAGHQFLRYGMPQAFGDVTDEERRRYGPVLERQYAALDAEVGRVLSSMGPEDVLMVVSGFGMAPVSPGKRVLGRLMREPEQSGSHEGAPDGFLLAYGAGVARGRLPVGSVVDLTPTVLYALGLPVARDMDGTARTDVFAPAVRARRPVTYIPSYDR